MELLILILVLHLLASMAGAEEAFVDHGVGAPVAESRGVVAASDAEGNTVVITLSLDNSPRGWILLTDVKSGTSEQYYYPEGVPNSPPFASLMSANGRFYTFAGNVLLEFDVKNCEWLFHGIPSKSESAYCGSAMVDGPGGLIFAGSYPSCRLVSYDPATQEMKDYGRLDDAEHYVMSLVADDAGWLYAGIGTARQNIVAFNPATGERRDIAQEDDRVLGSGSVRVGTDGQVYGLAGKSWYRMHAGEAEKVDGTKVPNAKPTGAIDWGRKSWDLPGGGKVKTVNLPERWMEITDAQGQTTRLDLDYKSEGADITSLVLGPDKMVYASTAHPMHFVALNPETGELADWGPVPRVGGGNFCAMDSLGRFVYGAAYAGGHFYEYDTTRPWNNETGDNPNPRLIGAYPGDITRPRACLAHPDGRHVMMAGFAGYGMCGGGMAIYDQTAGEVQLITHENLVPFQSTIALDALPDGNVVGGTSISTPGGGHPQAKEAVVYVLDWATRKVKSTFVPVPGAPEIPAVIVGPDGLVYGAASSSRFFVLNPQTGEVVHEENLSAYGGTPRKLFALGPDGMIYAGFTGAIVRIEPGTFKHQKLASPPTGISAGLVLHEGRLYYASRSHLWSYDIPTGEE
ncbi:MAG: hypothetical protein QM473_21880 [Acidobacteriota bacterium]|nr:hypothetical protein [Acidobacteriota bacterium]